MSIFSGALDINADDHADDCARWVPIEADDNNWGRIAIADDQRWGYAEDQPCTCGRGPIAYQGSHVIPRDTDRRGGSFDLAEIPGYINSGGRETEQPGYDEVWPWLRAWITDEQTPGPDHLGAVVLLDREHVERIYSYLGDWLQRTKDPT